MKNMLLATLLFSQMNAIEYELQFENAHINVAKVKILPHEEIGLHRDALPQVVIAIKGGTITRLEADGSINEVNFPTGTAVYREVDPPELLHRSVNSGDEIIELIIIQLKDE